ncbi:MAG TPA: APC family permease [Acidimicrobiia bacterium]|nr:APC family permease [Acidimicrobiia bacterium]
MSRSSPRPSSEVAHQELRRELGLGGAVVTGLGSIVGTGAFVAIGVASGMWGDLLLWAIPMAAVVAVFNGMSSAFLAGRFPVAGGTYEYGYQALNPWLGFTAGWLFLLAKTASAATAALGIALYLGVGGPLVPILSVVGVTTMVLFGLRRTAWLNTALVVTSASAIVWFAASSLSKSDGAVDFMVDMAPGDLAAAIAFLFVAYTGYGRIATLGEEVKSPEIIIPRAVIITLAAAAGLYMLVELGGRAVGGPTWGAETGIVEAGGTVVAVGAIAAMLGVLLNLILGLSRVWLAMGRRGDMPRALARLDGPSQPVIATILSASLVAALTLLGDIGLAWSFSAMTVLLYYGITNLAALAIDARRVTGWLGLVSCVFLSFFVPLGVWLTGAALILGGLLWKTGYRRGS